MAAAEMELYAWLVVAGVAWATCFTHHYAPEPAGGTRQPTSAQTTETSNSSDGAPIQDAASPPTLERFEFSQPHMGTQFTLILYAADTKVANRASEIAFRRIRALDVEILSDYQSNSEITRLSQSAPSLRPIKLSDDLFQVLLRSQQISQQSDGAFDVTVGPLTKLWRRARRREELPPAARLDAARLAVGYRYLELDPKGKTAKLLQPKMRLDLGGIAKGYAVDQALAELSQCGISRALVNAGGDLAASGPPPDRPGWRIGIAPLKSGAPPSQFGNLAHAAIATSGDAFQFVEINGERYSHIVDPRTGVGLTDRSSVSILAPDCTTADGYASATSVLGPQAGLEMIKQLPHVEALIVFERDGQTKTCRTDGFAAWLSSNHHRETDPSDGRER
jgi:thiamine biosynthesis lipoprotein